MSLLGALNVGKTALAVHQAAIQVTGNNIANAGDPTYTRQTASVSPNRDQQIRPGVFIGTGINLTGVQRQIDEALQGRIRSSEADFAAADATQQWLGRVEAAFNELTDQDLSTQMSVFFNSFSDLANKPQDVGLRQVVLQAGQSLADMFHNLRGQLGSLQSDSDERLKALTSDANGLAQQVADLNSQIVQAEGASNGTANSLRDQRDAILGKLSELIEIKTIQDGSVMNVYVGSEPLVLNSTSRGVALKQESIDGNATTTVVFKSNGGVMKLDGGQIGAISQVRSAHIDGLIDKLDSLAGSLIFELNKLHAAGQGLTGFSTVTSDTVADPAAGLNTADADLPFAPVNGSLVVHVKQKSTGLVTSTLVQVDLDGRGAETSLNSLAGDIDGIANISANLSAGRLTISADSADVEISFSQDSSGVLASLGINTFFSGKNAASIAVKDTVRSNPSMLAAAKNGDATDNQTARAIAALETTTLTSLGGGTLKAEYQSMVNGVANSAAAAKTNSEAASTVLETLQAQREMLSGVSLDEEAINLVRQQRAFQGAARLISAVDEMMRTLLNMV